MRSLVSGFGIYGLGFSGFGLKVLGWFRLRSRVIYGSLGLMLLPMDWAQVSGCHSPITWKRNWRMKWKLGLGSYVGFGDVGLDGYKLHLGLGFADCGFYL